MTKVEFYEDLTTNLKATKNYTIKHDSKELYIATSNNFVRVNFYRDTVTVYNDTCNFVDTYYYTGNMVVLTEEIVNNILHD